MIRKIIIVCLLITCLYAQTAIPPSAGNGSEADPYQIASLENLFWITADSTNWDKHYIQTADIDAAATKTWFSGAGWTPIGTEENEFTGNYNGMEFNINNLFINRDSTDYVGLFGYIFEAKINCLGLKDVEITGMNYTGGIIGKSYSSIINNCISSGIIMANGVYEKYGGLIGECDYSRIDNCYSTVDVIPNKYYNYKNVLIDYRTDYVGGLIGSSNNQSIINNCYSVGKVGGERSTYTGGLVGGNGNRSTILNCFSMGSVLANQSNWKVGGLIGSNYNSSRVNNSFWDIETSNISSSSGGTGKSTIEMKTIETFSNAGWNIESIWMKSDSINNGYLSFVEFLEQMPILETSSIYNTASGTVSISGKFIYYGQVSSFGVCWNTEGSPNINDSIILNDSTQMNEEFVFDITYLEKETKYYFRSFAINNKGIIYGEQLSILTPDIDPIKPLGEGTKEEPYQVATLNNLCWITENNTSWNSNFIQIADINAVNTVTWYDSTGWKPIGEAYRIDGISVSNIFTGYYNGQGYTIDNLYINHNDLNNQGLFGIIANATIINLGIKNCNITGSWQVGTLVGSAGSSRIHNCYSSGYVNGQSKVGGLVGSNYSNESISSIYNSYSTATILGDRGAGFVGQNSSGGQVINCYSCGSSSASGFVYSNSSGFIANSFWDIEASGQTSSSGAEGLTTLEMKTDTTFINASWDMDNIWDLDENTNNGYPYLIDSISANPIIITQVVSENSVIPNIQGSVISLGNFSSFTYGVCWNESGNPTIHDNNIEQGIIDQGGSFNCDLTQLAITGNVYYIRAFLINDGNIFYGNVVEYDAKFTSIPPEIGDGTEGNPYQISTLENLYWLAANTEHWNKHYVQTDDINASECKNWIYDSYYYGWKPIGSNDYPFTGAYDGQYHIIDSLAIMYDSHYDDLNFQGLFGVVNDADISNMGLTNADIQISRGAKIGSLVGYCDSSNVKNCYCLGSIRGRNYVGGLIGYLNNTTVTRCYTKGKVQLSIYDELGGITGYANHSVITNCYSDALVTGGHPGPIMSENSVNTTVDNCYSTGIATAGENIFGIPGETNFWLFPGYYPMFGSIYYQSTMRTSWQMQYPTTYLEAGWDFVVETENGTEDIWDIDTSGVINNGYPFLAWEHPDTTCFTNIDQVVIPEEYLLSQNYPNPFNPNTTISYRLSAIGDVELVIYDISGRKIKQWSCQNQQAGTYDITWNGTNQHGNPVSSGVYIYRMVAGEFVESRKMVLLK
ncbi:MAG: T9SS type A sorting domain-containing protein [Candidatus Marinimicrobia bacterium]|nr:T9SS type A sorting domain-containing protein [Candidatus Neomarinimicrobiota bacterium]